MSESPSQVVVTAQQALALLGHPDDRWSIVLHARVSEGIDRQTMSFRLIEAFASRPRLGPPPQVATLPTGDLDAALKAAASEPYGAGEPAVRVTLIDGAKPGVLLAAHHGVLDGLGLLALLGIALGEPVVSSARGVGLSALGRTEFWAFAARRVMEALVRQPTRISGTPPSGCRDGEAMAELVVPAVVGGTAALITAVVRTVQRWNQRHGDRAHRIVVAIGASQRSGSTPSLEHKAAWMRIRPRAADVRSIRAALRMAHPLPAGPSSDRFARAGTIATSLLSRRLGSTLLVSNLGSVSGVPDLQGLSFYPVTHGDRAVALGAVTVGDLTTLTLRGEAYDFDTLALDELLAQIAQQLRWLSDYGR